MTSVKQRLHWQPWVERVEELIVAVLALLLVLVVVTILGLTVYLFATNVTHIIGNVESVADIQQASLRSFSGVLLTLLGLELLDTVKVYFRDHQVRVEVILLVSLIAMGRHVLEIDLHHTEPLVLIGIASLILVLAVSYYLVKRAQLTERPQTLGSQVNARRERAPALTPASSGCAALSADEIRQEVAATVR
jgi:uncharacterized membrane protein (DUF373 family)